MEWLAFPLSILFLGMGLGFFLHGFKVIEIHKHYHNKP